MTHNFYNNWNGRLGKALAVVLPLLIASTSIAQDKKEPPTKGPNPTVHSTYDLQKGAFRNFLVRAAGRSYTTACCLQDDKKCTAKEICLGNPTQKVLEDKGTLTIKVMAYPYNPYCFLFEFNGQLIQGPCYCYPGESPQANNCIQ